MELRKWGELWEAERETLLSRVPESLHKVNCLRTAEEMHG